jgi:hypothetical protein
VRPLARARSAIFAGDPRVWRIAAIAAVPLIALIAAYCLWPREYFTGTNSVEVLTYIAPAKPGQRLCVPGLRIPEGSERLRLQVISATTRRPALRLRLTGTYAGSEGLAASSYLPPTTVGANRISNADFVVPGRLQGNFVTACVTAGSEVNWGGTPLPAPPPGAPTINGAPLPGQIAVWYLPRTGAKSSYLARASSILDRAALFRPGFVGPWLYWLILLGVLPAAAVAAVRVLAVAAASESRTPSARRIAAWVYCIAAVNFACWALITPIFQAPDEVDHFAYTQMLAERGEAPSQDLASTVPRWTTSESRLLEYSDFSTDHQIGDSRAPWEARGERDFARAFAREHPSASDGGGHETIATYGPLYYAALVPAYALASNSPIAQLTLMRLLSALIGALTVLFAFLIGRELAPRRPWIGVAAALLVAFQPMYGFISGAVNNDVGVNAAAAALQLLVILILRRGWRVALCVALGLLLFIAPLAKQSVLEIYPLVGLALLAALWRRHGRSELPGLGVLAVCAIVGRVVATRVTTTLHPVGAATAAIGSAAESVVSAAEAHPSSYLSYVWQVFLPRLPFMARHFETSVPPGYLIYVKRGWGSFGWYVILFPAWVFLVIFAAMIGTAVLAVLAVWREWAYVRSPVIELAFLALCPVAVVLGVEAAFYTEGVRPVVAEFGRYAFPAIAPLALLAVGSLHAFGRRGALTAAAALVPAMIALGFAGQLLTLAGFFA